MAVAAIEIHDAGLLAIGEDGTLLAPSSPGCALVEDGGILTGEEAARRCRLTPKRVHDRFWSELETTPLGRPFPDGLAAADLAHAHLESFWSRAGATVDSITLALPGSAGERQLGLALGIARACGLPVRGLVDAGVAACAYAAADGRTLHLDAQLHRMVLTEVEAGESVIRRSVKVIAGTGLRSLRDAWLRRIGELFVQRTRFDPLHAAATEQELFDRLPDLLDALVRAETAPVELGDRRSIDLARADLEAAAAAEYDAIVRLVAAGFQEGTAALRLSATAASLPGLSSRLAADCGVAAVALPAGAAARAALAHRGAIEAGDEALPFVTRLPSRRSPAAPDPAAGASRVPTHLVHAGLAHPLTGAALHLSRALPPGARGVRVSGDGQAEIRLRGDAVIARVRGAVARNGLPAHGELELHAGDRLQVGGTEVLLVRLVEPDGPT